MDPLTSFLTPAEHLVISRWLGLRSLVVRPGLTAKQALARVLRGVETADFLESFEDRSKAAVAAILLKHLQDRLPQWASVRSDSDGKKQVTLGRRPRRPRGEPSLEPRFLFGINWATSGPGFSWPSAYTVTYVPGYGRYVVVESLDCVDVRGACDVALGSFPAGRDLLAACREIVISDWSTLSFEGQTRFEQVTDLGLFDAAAIGKMANEVWDSEDDEEPEDGEHEPEDADPGVD